MATQEDRSLSSGMSIPRWMKTKMNDKLDIDQSTFSPTEIDDSFMLYYRYPRGTSEPKQVKDSSIVVSSVGDAKQDFSKHTAPCQKYLQNGNECATAQQVVYPIPANFKSSGIDDGFKGEAAKCGSSIIKVAQQMVSGKIIRGFNVEENKSTPSATEDKLSNTDAPPPGFNPSMRRGSKSLPASPLTSPGTSPKSRRRINKYFTGAFVDADKAQGSWILSSLLAKRANLSQSVDVIAEEDAGDGALKKMGSIASSVDNLADKKSSVYKAKPSELREMNFWSPTSM